MQITTQLQHRALAFIDACNASGYLPSVYELQRWLLAPTPELSLVDHVVVPARGETIPGWIDDDIDSYLTHLQELEWIDRDSNSELLTITELGRALLAASERAEDADEGSTVVLDSEDQFAYAKLIGHLNRAGEGLLVDPYFRVDQLMTILENTQLSRVLISKQHKNSKGDRAALAVALASPVLPRSLEVRASDDEAVHDRIIVGQNEEVWLLGASLSSVGRVNTVIIPVPKEGASGLRDQAERLWDTAEPVRSVESSAKETPASDETAVDQQ